MGNNTCEVLNASQCHVISSTLSVNKGDFVLGEALWCMNSAKFHTRMLHVQKVHLCETETDSEGENREYQEQAV